MQNILGPRIAEIRRVRGLTQAEVARRLQVTPAALSQWERGLRPFPLSRIAAAEEALGVSGEDALISREGPPSPPDANLSEAASPTAAGSGGGRLPQLRPPYPPGATIEQVAAMGRFPRQVIERVEAALPADEMRLLSEAFPRDTRHELLVTLGVAQSNATVSLATPAQWRCPLHVMHDLNEGVGDHLLQPVIVRETGDELTVFFGQPWLNVARYQPIRVDFLVYHRPKGERGYWLWVEIDDKSSHAEKRYRDAARELSLALPGLRYENHVVTQPWFPERLLADIRGKRDEAAERRRDRLRRARRRQRKREQQAAARRSGAWDEV